MGQRLTVAQVGDIPEGDSKVVRCNGKPVAVYLIDGEYHAIDDMCPHMGASLSAGWVGVMTSTLHYWRFRLCDGAWADNPKVKTGSYQVHVEGEDIQLELPEPEAGASDE